MMDNTLIVGEVLRPQGLRGEVKVKPLTDDPDRFFDLRRVFLRGEEKRCRCIRVHEGYAYLQLDGIFSREAAEGIRGELLHIRREDAVKLPKDTDFICDLIGCEAVDTEGRMWGKLVVVLQPGSCDVYVFRSDDGRELMIPALKRVVLQTRPDEKHILLDAQGVRETGVTEDTENA